MPIGDPYPQPSPLFISMNQTSPRQSIGGSVPAPRPQTQVGAYLNDLDTAMEHFAKSLEVHQLKLEPVLREAQPQKESGESPQECLCPLASRIRTSAQRLNELVRRLSELTDRTEA